MRLVMVLCIASSFLATAAQADVVTAAWQLETDMNSYAGIGGCGVWKERGQTFLAQQSGQLLSASMRMYRNSSTTVSLRVSIYAVNGATGLPEGEALYQEDYPAQGLHIGQPAQPETFVFSGTTPILQAGQYYALAMTDADAAGSGSYFTLNGLSNSLATYADGQFVNRPCGGSWEPASYPLDLGFSVTVDETVATASASWSALKALYGRD